MEKRQILIDTSILIDYYRKKDKSKAIWLRLIRSNYSFAVSVISQYEIYAGANSRQLNFWNQIFKTVDLLPFTSACVQKAVEINASLKRKRKQIDIPDLFIAATAMANDLPISTLNQKHFSRIDSIQIVEV